MNQNQPEDRPINYLYFGALFALLIITSTSSILLKDDLAGSRIFFWLYALGQSVFEVAAFIFVGSLIHDRVGRKAFTCFIGFTFICFLLHLIDFALERVLDLSAFGGVKAFILGENFEGFLLLLDASSISLHIWILIFSLLFTLPLFGLIFYIGTEWLAHRKPFRIKKEVFLQLFVCIPAALFFWDYSASGVIHPDAYSQFVKSLPWKQTFLRPETVEMPLNAKTRVIPSETNVAAEIDRIQPKLTKKPNVYLIVTETLRADFITPQIAPHLYAFGHDHINATYAFSGANWTAISWFSIFHSQFPFYWSLFQKQGWQSGSPALQAFKKLGYKIRVYSSTQLAFYGMDKLIFGKEKQLADSIQTFYHPAPKQAYESDSETLEALKHDLASDPSLQEGQLIVLFWDGPHFDYSSPKTSPFEPSASHIDFFQTFPTEKKIEKIKNRYRNAVHQIDTLFGDFISWVDPQAIVAFTGDHGEEFFDHGHLFHGSHLSQEQISIPLYFRVGSYKTTLPLLSQLDIMPTLLDAISYQTYPFLQGESALRTKQWPYAIAARFNGRQSPYEFSIFNQTNKCMVQFNNRKEILHSTGVEILSLRNSKDGSLFDCGGDLKEWVHINFGPAFDKIFLPD